jgi:hypothetical protein
MRRVYGLSCGEVDVLLIRCRAWELKGAASRLTMMIDARGRNATDRGTETASGRPEGASAINNATSTKLSGF